MMLKTHALIMARAVAATLLTGSFAGSGVAAPAAWWPLDETREGMVTDKAGGIDDAIDGSFTKVAGVRGGAIRFDGYTTEITRDAEKAPALSGGFAVEGSVALGAYPWNWCPLVTQRADESSGFRVDIGPRGQLRMQVKAGGEWVSCESGDFVVELWKWTHLAASFDPKSGITLFANGGKVGELAVTGEPVFAPNVEMKIGADHAAGKPSNLHRPFGTLESWFSLDGIVDEVKVHNQALDAAQVGKAFASLKTSAKPELPPRRLPSGPPGPGRFGAYYAHLKYYPEWDALWPVGQDPDVVVRFDTSPARLVFWRGTRYSAAWVSGNEFWMADQSVEAWNKTEGCFEHMQDRRCRYSHVRVIESNEARVVVHWRYAPVSAHNHLWRVNEKTTRACWVDEYYYIYPDVAGIRNVSWKSGTLGGPRQFQESLPLSHPGQYPCDVVEPGWATVANYAGETGTLYYKENPAKEPRDDLPGELTIQRYNFKSEQKPFICFEPGNRMKYLKDRDIRGITGPGSCNHWPVGQAICDGRTSQAADRPTHFCGFPISDPPVYDDGEREGWHGFYGMTGRDMDGLVRLGRSWARAAELKPVGGLSSGEYDRGQRAYVLKRKKEGGEPTFELAASGDSPVINPAFVIEDWGGGEATVEIDGKAFERGPGCRIGRRERLDGADLVVWLKLDTEKPVKVRLIPTP